MANDGPFFSGSIGNNNKKRRWISNSNEERSISHNCAWNIWNQFDPSCRGGWGGSQQRHLATVRVKHGAGGFALLLVPTNPCRFIYRLAIHTHKLCVQWKTNDEMELLIDQNGKERTLSPNKRVRNIGNYSGQLRAASSSSYSHYIQYMDPMRKMDSGDGWMR